MIDLDKKVLNREFDIKFTGLAIGKHEYQFVIDNRFLAAHEFNLIHDALVHLNFCMDKQNESLYILTFSFNGKIGIECDRCLNQFDLSFSRTHQMIMKVANERVTNSMDDDIIYVSPKDFKINIADHINEFILMEIPIKVTCDLAGLKCDSAMIERLNQFSK